MEAPHHQLTHEKHLDHLVRVVPLLCLAYGLQSFMMIQYAAGGPTGNLIILLGLSLALSVLALVTYDLKHRVGWDEHGFHYQGPWELKGHDISREEISAIEIIGAPEEFQTVVVKMHNQRKITFYFVDNGYDFKYAMEFKASLQQAA